MGDLSAYGDSEKLEVDYRSASPSSRLPVVFVASEVDDLMFLGKLGQNFKRCTTSVLKGVLEDRVREVLDLTDDEDGLSIEG